MITLTRADAGAVSAGGVIENRTDRRRNGDEVTPQFERISRNASERRCHETQSLLPGARQLEESAGSQS